MPSFAFNNIAFTGKLSFVPLIKGAVFTASQYAKIAKGVTADLFGSSVAATASEMAVTATGAASNAGVVYLYNRTGDDWSDNLSITGAASSKMGQSVDINSEWLVVGAIASGNGSVYVYRKVGGTWNTTPFQTITTTDSGINFGYSVSLSGTSLAIGHREANGGVGSTQIWVFDGTTWAKQATITVASNMVPATTSQRLGWSVSLAGNLLIVGGANTTGVGNGAALVSTRSGTTWSTPAILLPPAGTATANGFGASVLVNNGKLIVGMPNQNTVFVYNNVGGTWTQSAKLDVSSTGVIVDSPGAARVGWSLSANAAGTVIFAGAVAYATPGTGTGTVYVFESVDGVWGPSAINTNGVSRLPYTPTANNTRFGWCQAMSGSQLIVGTNVTGTALAGSVFTFK